MLFFNLGRYLPGEKCTNAQNVRIAQKKIVFFGQMSSTNTVYEPKNLSTIVGKDLRGLHKTEMLFVESASDNSSQEAEAQLSYSYVIMTLTICCHLNILRLA